MTNTPLISVVVPIYNEARSLQELYNELQKTMNEVGKPYEIIFVDDGSRDTTREIASKIQGLHYIRLKRNFGQTVAFSVGIQKARGEIIITMDGDLENNPADIPNLLSKLNEGFDVVSGWRQSRWANARFSRKLPSKMANWLLCKVSDLSIHDFGCMLKVYKKKLFDDISFSGDMHRMFLVYMAKNGAKITEVPVAFSPRKYGSSNYGVKRVFHVLMDILAFYFFEKFHNKPLHFFGLAGFFAFVLSTLTFAWMVALKAFEAITYVQTPLPVLTVSFAIVGFQFILMGLVAELVYRFHKEKTAVEVYVKEEIKKETN
ncbi:glycosyltransferase family 2 protein [Candidatus Parcubacteria bacterium]|nr:glycosyltransferase family 2 protein [Candidatus Parcubacteria bacterium]